MALTLKLSKSKSYNPSKKEYGFRTTVKSNGKADMDSLVESASKNTTMHKAEITASFMLMLDAIRDALSSGKMVEMKGIGNIGFSCSGAWTATAEEQNGLEHKVGISFYPSQEVAAAVATARTVWAKAEEAKDDASGDDGKGDGSDTGGEVEG